MSTDLTVTDDRPHALSMVDGPDPDAALAYARKLAGSLTKILNGATTKIQGREHVNIEGWQSLAAATGHTCEVEWTRPVDGIDATNGVYAWEARAVVRDQAGTVVAAGESMADPAERGAVWARANYSVRGMAQTRAMSRALSSRMRYVVQLGGMSGTPAEEMPTVAVDPRETARDRYRVLKAIDGMDEAILKEAASDPAVLSDDAEALRVAYSLGHYMAQKKTDDVEVVDGEVVEAETA